MKIAFAMLARDVRIDGLREIDLLGVFDRLEISAFPARLETLYLVVRFEVHRTEIEREQVVEIVVADEDGGRLCTVGRRLTIADRGWDDSSPAQPEYAIQAYAFHGLVLREPGTYAFDVLVNGAHAVHVPLFVRRVQPPAPVDDAAAPWSTGRR